MTVETVSHLSHLEVVPSLAIGKDRAIAADDSPNRLHVDSASDVFAQVAGWGDFQIYVEANSTKISDKLVAHYRRRQQGDIHSPKNMLRTAPICCQSVEYARLKRV
ncbi:hypothetical protein M7I_7504 [Glarea lozoyensis 74030]|uniref:Uncharacterized protein n=1 Tax=Glarea lozoyensis (strain ATCC 74030 / MF5533) TaxID=1104152 RepID=H0EXG8_GLAL7|nr:hypothetical protein M7I_7504 [Glarea lozoyensis 74030]